MSPTVSFLVTLHEIMAHISPTRSGRQWRQGGAWPRTDRPLLVVAGACLGRLGASAQWDVMIAYQVMGDGPFDVVIAPGWVSHVELQ
jgi:hypothetical protein